MNESEISLIKHIKSLYKSQDGLQQVHTGDIPSVRCIFSSERQPTTEGLGQFTKLCLQTNSEQLEQNPLSKSRFF